jgi:methionyl-tRNA formyltransferase
LIRGCDPSPGAWTTHDGRRLFLFDAHKRLARTRAEVKGKQPGQVAAAGGGVTIQGQGGSIVVQRVRYEDGKKIAAEEAGLTAGTILGR